MTSVPPLRVPVTRGVPELGPMLGRLAEPAASPDRSIALESARVALLSALFDAAGTAREAMDRGDRDGARQALALATWLELFRAQAAGLAEQCGRRCRTLVEQGILASRMPAARREALLPTEEDLTVIRNRATAAGIPLEQCADPVLADDWADGLRVTAMALEVSWDRLVGVLRDELDYWLPRAARAAAWTRPRTPLHLITAAVLLGALLLGLSIGGYLPAPGPLGVLRDWWWSLPWP